MATNKPHFGPTTYGKLNPGDLVWEPHWKQQGYGAGRVKQIVDLHANVSRIIFDDNTNVMRNSSHKCFASSPTPTTRDWEDGKECKNVPTNSPLGREVWKTSGQMQTGSDVPTGSSGQLNPAHSRWLMGYPPEWDDCAVMVVLLCRK